MTSQILKKNCNPLFRKNVLKKQFLVKLIEWNVVKVSRRGTHAHPPSRSIRLKFIGIDVSTRKKRKGKKKQKWDTKGTGNYRFRSVRHTGSFYSYSLHYERNVISIIVSLRIVSRPRPAFARSISLKVASQKKKISSRFERIPSSLTRFLLRGLDTRSPVSFYRHGPAGSSGSRRS